jgi:hypothetical protein
VTTEKRRKYSCSCLLPPNRSVKKNTRPSCERMRTPEDMFYFGLLAVFFPVRITPELTAALINKNIQREERAHVHIKQESLHS